MEPTDRKTPTVAWQQVVDAVASGAQHPEETKWTIYRYLKQNYPTLGSKETRMLLAAYIKLYDGQPSLVHSCMLALALKVSETYDDFRLPQYLQACGYDAYLRADDRQPQTGSDGRRYLSLHERVERALAAYLLHYPQEERTGCTAIVSMYAVKVFEKEQNGRRRRFVKLVAPSGASMVVDSHQFPGKPWEIVGRLFDVLVRVSKQGNERAAEIVASDKKVDDVFASEVGYVGGIDEGHGHVHVYDAQSRHLVAGKETVFVQGVAKGCYVRFCPIIAQGDPFKSAAIVGVLPVQAGRKAFGAREATVQYVNRAEHYMKYTLCQTAAVQSAQGATAADGLSAEGYASFDVLPAAMAETLAAGQHVHLVVFLKRGKDGVKRNYVADAF